MFYDTNEIDMKNIILTEETRTTPEIKLDSVNGVISFKGKIITVDCESLFKPLFDWLNLYVSHPASKTDIQIHLDYFNTLGTKYLTTFLKKVEKQLSPTNEAKIYWFYDMDDEDMLEIAEDFQTVINLPFEMIETN